MKSIRLLFLVLLASLTTIFTSCKDKEPQKNGEEKDITLAVNGNNGAVITVLTDDVPKTITIKASETVDRDVEVNLTLDPDDGSAKLSSNKVIIAKGTDFITTKVSFLADNFTKGTAERAIKVKASTTDSKVTFSPDFTTFNVKGLDGVATATIITATSPALKINTTNAKGVAIVNFSLTKPLDKEIVLECTYGYTKDFIGNEGVSWSMNPIRIPAGETSMTFTISVPKGSKGSMNLNFACEDISVLMETTLLEFQFEVTGVVKPEVSLSATATKISIKDVDVKQTIDIKLDRAVAEDVTVNLDVTSSNSIKGKLSTSAVVFTAGETSKTVNITFAAADFTKDTAANITVSATSSDADVIPTSSSILFKVTGPTDKKDAKVFWSINYDNEDFNIVDGDIVFTAADETKGYMEFSVYAEITNPLFTSGFDPAIVFDCELTGTLSEADIEVFIDPEEPKEEWELLYSNSDYGYVNFKILKSAIGKSGTINFTSKDVTFIDTQAPVKIKVIRK